MFQSRYLTKSAILTLGLQATGYQRKGTKRKIILLLILLVVGMFIVLLVKPRRRSGEGKSPTPLTDSVTANGAPFK